MVGLTGSIYALQRYVEPIPQTLYKTASTIYLPINHTDENTSTKHKNHIFKRKGCTSNGLTNSSPLGLFL